MCYNELGFSERRIEEAGYDMREYEVFLEEAEEGGYVVSCPSLPGCVSEGETREEALANITDAIEGYLTVLKNHGDNAPRVDVVKVRVAA